MNNKKLIAEARQWANGHPNRYSGELMSKLADALEAVTVPAPTGDERERLKIEVTNALGDAMLCSRVWEAWGYGTMSEEDFSNAADDAEFVEQIVSAVLAARPPAPVEVEWEYGIESPENDFVDRFTLQDAQKHVMEWERVVKRTAAVVIRVAEPGPWVAVEGESK